MSNMKFIYKNNGVVLQTEYSSEELMNLFDNKNFVNFFQSDSSSFFPSFDDIAKNTKNKIDNTNRNNSVSFIPTVENNIILSFLMDIHEHIKLNRKQTAAYLYEISKFKSPDLIFSSNMKNKLNFKIPEHIVKKYKDVVLKKIGYDPTFIFNIRKCFYTKYKFRIDGEKLRNEIQDLSGKPSQVTNYVNFHITNALNLLNDEKLIDFELPKNKQMSLNLEDIDITEKQKNEWIINRV